MDRDNIYWLFSSSAQSIAAFIGFLTAGFYFVLDKIDNNQAQDETLSDILYEIKKTHFLKLKILCYLTGFSIILSLVLVFLNKYDFTFRTFLIILVSLINLVTIIWAISFVIEIIDPEKIEKTANKLILKNKDINISESTDSIQIGAFLEKYIKLENLVRNSFKTLGLSPVFEEKEKTFIKITDIFMLLFQLGHIKSDTLSDLTEVNKIRNLAAHGQIQRIDVKVGVLLDELIQKISNLKNNL